MGTTPVYAAFLSLETSVWGKRDLGKMRSALRALILAASNGTMSETEASDTASELEFEFSRAAVAQVNAEWDQPRAAKEVG